MNRKLTRAALLPAAAWLAMLCACPPSRPPGVGGCAAESEACATSSDCCDGLSCVDEVCVTPPTACAAEGEGCTGSGDCCNGLTCVDGACATPSEPCAAEDAACSDADNCCEGLECVDGMCATPPSGTQAAVPAKTIGFDLMGIHDPDSETYDGNCIGCHGDRTDEVALDGVTPAAHATMAGFFGEGNDRCVSCHNGGPNFYDSALGSGSLSSGALREQVDMEAVNCAGCHGPNTAVALYAE